MDPQSLDWARSFGFYTNSTCIQLRRHPLKSTQWFQEKVGVWLWFTTALCVMVWELGEGVWVNSGWTRWVTVSGCCDRWCRRSPCRSRTWKQAAVMDVRRQRQWVWMWGRLWAWGGRGSVCVCLCLIMNGKSLISSGYINWCLFLKLVWLERHLLTGTTWGHWRY